MQSALTAALKAAQGPELAKVRAKLAPEQKAPVAFTKPQVYSGGK